VRLCPRRAGTRRSPALRGRRREDSFETPPRTGPAGAFGAEWGEFREGNREEAEGNERGSGERGPRPGIESPTRWKLNNVRGQVTGIQLSQQRRLLGHRDSRRSCRISPSLTCTASGGFQVTWFVCGVGSCHSR